MTKQNDMKFSTKAIHLGQEPDPTTGAVITPIYQTSTFVQEAPGVDKGYDYSRSGNPTRTALETVLAGLENGAHGYAFASGMAALTTMIVALMETGDHIIVGDDVYGGTNRFFNKVMKKYGIAVTYVDMSSTDNLKAAITDETKIAFFETPTNPLLKLADLSALIPVANEAGLITCVDNTFATPYLQQPFAFGADIILHSTTKYIGGHSDVVGGALILRDDTYAEDIKFFQNSIGATPDPFAAWLTLRGIKTLAARMQAHCRNAAALAVFLEEHNAVEEVIYPGLPSHPDHELAEKQMKAPGGMISFRINGGKDEATQFLQALTLFRLAESLGGVESLIEIPSVMTHASLSQADRDKLGITDNLIRVSVGIEDLDDLRADMGQALSRVSRV